MAQAWPSSVGKAEPLAVSPPGSGRLGSRVAPGAVAARARRGRAARPSSARRPRPRPRRSRRAAAPGPRTSARPVPPAGCRPRPRPSSSTTSATSSPSRRRRTVTSPRSPVGEGVLEGVRQQLVGDQARGRGDVQVQRHLGRRHADGDPGPAEGALDGGAQLGEEGEAVDAGAGRPAGRAGAAARPSPPPAPARRGSRPAPRAPPPLLGDRQDAEQGLEVVLDPVVQLAEQRPFLLQRGLEPGPVALAAPDPGVERHDLLGQRPEPVVRGVLEAQQQERLAGPADPRAPAAAPALPAVRRPEPEAAGQGLGRAGRAAQQRRHRLGRVGREPGEPAAGERPAEEPQRPGVGVADGARGRQQEGRLVQGGEEPARRLIRHPRPPP